MNEKNTQALKKTTMSTLGVVAMIYSFIAAGAFGIEETIPISGPGIAIILLAVFPFIWGYPLTNMVAELGSLYPTEGGVYSWGRESMGEFWGWIIGFWSGVSTWLCQAQYCALVAGYAAKFIELNAVTEYLIKLLVVVIFTVINIMGISQLEKLETVFTVLVLVAFAAVTIVGFLNWNYNPIDPMYNADEGMLHSIGGSIAVVIWMYCGYECMSNMAGEIENPQVIPKAMRISQPVIALSYILPTVAALAAIGSWQLWSTESGGGNVGYADVLINYVGPWAGVAFIVIAIVSNCSIFSSYIAHGSRAFFVMADDHMFPKTLCKVDKRGIPTVSIIILAIFTLATCVFDFTTLVMITTPIQLYLYLLLAVIVIKVRKDYPVEARKEMGLTVMGGGGLGLIIFSILVVGICYIALIVNGTEYFIIGFAALAISLVLYMICKWVYKGRVLDDAKAYPLNPRTKLGMGDLIEIGKFTIVSGALSLSGSIFLYLYEVDYGVEYYLEEYETGLFSNFILMIDILKWMGIALLVIGIVVYVVGRKTEGEAVKALHKLQKENMDELIRQIHGHVPGCID